MRYLITPTLYSAYRYYVNCEPGEEEKKRLEFMGTLTKRGFEPTPAILKGYKFEDDIHAYCDGKLKDPHFVIQEIGDIVQGGVWQEKLSAKTQVNGVDILLYGKSDVIKEDTIYDIKRAGAYDDGKYKDSLQHLIYLYCTQLPKFRYLVGYGQGVDAEDWASEEYFLTDKTLPKIQSKVAELLGWLEAVDLLETYKKYWLCKY